jgi:phosphatidylglycerol:prolipoprotein diacylglycerol transferase
MYPTLQIGSLSLQVPGLVLIFGLWLGLAFSERRIKKYGKDPNYLYNLVFISLIFGVIGARLSYIVVYPDAFSTNLWNVISINPGLLDPNAGAFFAVSAGLIFIFRKKLPIWSVLDDLTPLLAVVACAQGVANLAAGSGFGSPTELPWGIHLWGAFRHPSQVYETFLASLILLVIHFIDRAKGELKPGNLFLIFISLSSLSRLFLEAFRGDSIIIGDGFRQAQIISWLVLAVCLALLIRNNRSGELTEASS